MGEGGGEELNYLNLDGKSKVGDQSGSKILAAMGEKWGGGMGEGGITVRTKEGKETEMKKEILIL
jgi:hypothetical protein